MSKWIKFDARNSILGYFYTSLPDTGPLISPVTWSGLGYVQFYDDGQLVGPIDRESPAYWPMEDDPDESTN